MAPGWNAPHFRQGCPRDSLEGCGGLPLTRILLTGATGQVGRELRRTLAVLGEVAAPARQEFNLASPDSIASAVRLARPDLIVNAAAYTAVDKAESEPDLAMDVNGQGPGVLAEEAARLDAVLVHYSTDYVFDGSKPEPYREGDSPAPLNVYGRTKLAGEKAIGDAGCPHFIFRTSWIYGPVGRNFLLTIIRLARERKELKIVDDQFGAPTLARFIAEATAEATARTFSRGRLDRDRFREMSGIYHLSAGGRTSWYEFAVEILRGREGVAAVLAIPGDEYPSPAKRPKNSLLDNTKLSQAFGISLPDWKTGLQQCMEEISRDRNLA